MSFIEKIKESSMQYSANMDALYGLSAPASVSSGLTVRAPIADAVVPSIPNSAAIPPMTAPSLPAPSPVGTTSVRAAAPSIARTSSTGATITARQPAGTSTPLSSTPSSSTATSSSSPSSSSQTSSSSSAAAQGPSVAQVARTAAKQGAIITFVISAVLNLFQAIRGKKSWKAALTHTLVDTAVGALGAAGGAVLATTLFGGTALLGGAAGLVIGLAAGWLVTGLITKLFGMLFGTKDDLEKAEQKAADKKKEEADKTKKTLDEKRIARLETAVEKVATASASRDGKVLETKLAAPAATMQPVVPQAQVEQQPVAWRSDTTVEELVKQNSLLLNMLLKKELEEDARKAATQKAP